MSNISDLSKFREGRDKAKKGKAPWVLEPVTARLGLTILAVDQSLGNAGWAIIEKDGSIGEVGNVKVTSSLDGHAGTLQQGEYQFEAFRHLLDGLPEVAVVVHETPPISRPGSKMMRPESSLVSATALRCAGVLAGVDVRMVGSQKAKKRFTGNGNATKAEVRQMLVRLYPSLLRRKPMNEHIRDAIAAGLVACEEDR